MDQIITFKCKQVTACSRTPLMYQQSFKTFFWVLPGNFTFQLFLPITDAVDSGVCSLDDVESFSHGVEDIENQLNLFLVGLTCPDPRPERTAL